MERGILVFLAVSLPHQKAAAFPHAFSKRAHAFILLCLSTSEDYNPNSVWNDNRKPVYMRPIKGSSLLPLSSPPIAVYNISGYNCVLAVVSTVLEFNVFRADWPN